MWRHWMMGSVVVFGAWAVQSNAFAVDTFGPPFGANRYTASIDTRDGIEDVDDYATALLSGERLSVTVAAAKGSGLLPVLELVAADGSVVTPPAKASKDGRSVKLAKFTIPATGNWGVRVAGRDGTQGAYNIAFKVTPAPASSNGLHFGGTDPAFSDFAIVAVDGAVLDVTIKYPKTGPAIHVGSLHDPAGAVVVAAVGVEKPGKTLIVHAPLSGGTGTYLLRLFVDSGEVTGVASIKLTPTNRPKSKKPVLLGSVEPNLDAIAAPIQGVAYRTVHLTGSGLGGTPAPTVFFGRVPGFALTVASDGRSLDVSAPPGVDDATVSVAVVAADGQGIVRDQYFHYVPAAHVNDLVLASTGLAVRGGSSAGGQAVRLLGTGFTAADGVRFGTRPAVDVTFVDATRIDLVIPPGAVGDQIVALVDAYGRSIQATFLFTFKNPPAFGSPAYSPAFGPVAGGATITISGQNFESNDVLVVNGLFTESSVVGPGQRQFTSPALAEGTYSVTLMDRFGSIAIGPDLEVRAAPTITSVTIIGGSAIGSTGIATGGGAIVRVVGTKLHASDVVAVGGTAGTVTTATTTLLTFVTPAGSPGLASLTVTDPVGQSATVNNALRFVGYDDQTLGRSPGATAVDDLAAQRGAVADLDGDGSADDLVLVEDKSAPGTRTERTRVFFGNGSQLVDQTGSKIPATGSDPFGIDDWHATTLAIGDLDGGTGPEIVIAGSPLTSGGYYSYTYYGYEARVLTNDGTGSFTFNASSPHLLTAPVYVSTGSGGYYSLYSSGSPGYYYYYAQTNPWRSGRPTALAIGDIDNDGRNDVVMAMDHYRYGFTHVAPNYVTFTPDNYTDSQAGSHYNFYGTYYYTSALRIFRNHGSAGFQDATFPRIPLAGVYPPANPPLPSFVGRDMKLADVEGDGDLDIVVTWDDPLTTSPIGQWQPGSDTEHACTRVLLNNGSGFFTDGTTTWMPADSNPEYWQGSRCEVTDLNGDGHPDLVLLLNAPLDRYNGGSTTTRSSLRILKNRLPTASGFQDVTNTALPVVPLAGTADDNLRGNALVVRDVDGDGRLDIIVGTTDPLADAAGLPVRRTRLLRGGPNLTFTVSNDFLPPTTTDTGEVEDLLVGDIAGNQDPSLILLGLGTPAQSPSSEKLRIEDWHR